MKSRRLLALAAIVAVAVALAAGLEQLGELSGVTQFENFTLDYRQTTTWETLRTGIGERESEIVLVLFDEFSVTDSVDGWDWISPFPRQHLAELIDALSFAGARTIGLDVYLDRLYPRLGGDEPLREAMERAGNVIIVTPVEQTDSGPVSAPPHPYFAEVAAGIGTAELPSSFETFRDGALAVRSGPGLAPSWALALYAHSRGLNADSLLAASLTDGTIDLQGLPERVGRVDPEWFAESAETGRAIVPFRIRFVGPPSSADAEEQDGTFNAVTSFSVPLIAPFSGELFENKIVLLGTGFHPEDRFRTPFQGFVPPPSETLPEPEPYGWMYGVEVHANALQNMLDGEYVRPMGGLAKLVLMVLAATFTGGVAFRWGAWWGGAALGAAVLAITTSALWAWSGAVYLPGFTLAGLGGRFLWIPVTVPLLSAAFSFVGSVAYVSIVEGREKRFIKGAFGMYLSPEVVADITQNPAALELGGEKRPISLLFSDLSGFTTMSEHMDAQDLLAILNEYLDGMTEIVLDQRGYLDKYIGDAIMAFWNAPKDVEDHPDRAIRTAILMQRKMTELNELWLAEDPEHETLKVRIGVHSGEVVVGNVGGKARFDYSAIGDAVNLAARLEPANKDYDTLNMVSETTLSAAEKAYRVRELDYIAVVGKEEPVKVFELLEEAGVDLPAEKERALELFDQGMQRYKQHRWTDAKELFDAAVQACPDDGPSLVYVRRCEENIADPPPPDWDFVVRRTKK